MHRMNVFVYHLIPTKLYNVKWSAILLANLAYNFDYLCSVVYYSWRVISMQHKTLAVWFIVSLLSTLIPSKNFN